MSARRKRVRQRERRRSQRRTNILVASILGVVGTVLGIVLVSTLAVHSVAVDLRGLDDEIEELSLGENTRIYDKNGRQLGIVAGVTNRTRVPGKRIPQILKDATVAIEDKRFYEHDGVDYYRLVGAAAHDVATGSARQGASTITMQLIKNLYNPDGGSRVADIGTKVEEAYLAFQYEKRFSKEQILSEYLNGVFYGQNAVGVQAASLTYFDRSVRDITLPQAALLAGLPQAPSTYNPFDRPRAARERRNVVLQEMASQGFISQETADKAKRSGLGLKRGRAYTRKREEYFFDHVQQWLVARYGRRQVQLGGFRVYTTIDPVLQRQARAAINNRLPYDDDPASAIVMVDNQNGYIRAMASSQEYSADNQFNYATQAERQPGSTFKTFVLAEAVRQGVDPQSTVYNSKPLKFDHPQWGPIDVSTYSHSYPGPVSIARATLSSDNSVYTQMTLDLGPQSIVDLAYDMGISRDRTLNPYPSVGLGAAEVTPLDMALAYAPLSNGGFRVRPVVVSKVVKPDGSVEEFTPGRQRVLTDGQAYEVTRVLQANVTSGTGRSAQLQVPSAGKTGTTDKYVDAWYVGYTPRYSTAVWVGYPNTGSERRSMYSVHGITVAGSTFPAQIWGDFMREAVAHTGLTGEFPQPEQPAEWADFESEYTRDAIRAQEREEAEEAAAAEAEAEADRARREAEDEDQGQSPSATTGTPPSTPPTGSPSSGGSTGGGSTPSGPSGSNPPAVPIP